MITKKWFNRCLTVSPKCTVHVLYVLYIADGKWPPRATWAPYTQKKPWFSLSRHIRIQLSDQQWQRNDDTGNDRNTENLFPFLANLGMKSRVERAKKMDGNWPLRTMDKQKAEKVFKAEKWALQTPDRASAFVLAKRPVHS